MFAWRCALMQRWYGDLVDVGPGRFLGNRIRVPMSTAIVRTYTSEGFVIAADGRARGTDDWKVQTDEAPQISRLLDLRSGEHPITRRNRDGLRFRQRDQYSHASAIRAEVQQSGRLCKESFQGRSSKA